MQTQMQNVYFSYSKRMNSVEKSLSGLSNFSHLIYSESEVTEPALSGLHIH